MTIELVKEKDCVSNEDRKRKIEKVKGSKSRYFKKINYRDRRRCFICGHNEGQWYEQFLKGRQVYHFLCQDCINTIENKK